MFRKSQVSMEYLLIIGFSVFIIIILLAVAQTYSTEINDQVTANQLDRLAKEIINNAESLYYFGDPSSVKIKAYIPSNIQTIDITDKELTFTVRTKQGDTDISYTSNVDLDGEISTAYGYKNIEISAREGYIWINGT